jgi:M6 family metalloprotease-like protein
MKHTLKGLIIVIIILLNTAIELFSIPAKPDPVNYKLPDGTTIEIVLKGDEKVRWAETIDGYSVLLNKDGFYEYALLDKNGDMVRSGIRAYDQEHRPDNQKVSLRDIPKKVHFSSSQVSMMRQIWQIKEKEASKAFPTTGNRKLICILIGFSDLSFTKTQTDFDNLFNQVGYSTGGATGSVKDYYLENSYDQFNLTVDVAGPYTASNTMAYYGANDGSGYDLRPDDLVTEAVNAANADVNFSDYDNDSDGNVDGVYVIYAGYGEEAGASANAIWAHAWAISTVSLDGVDISSYSCSAELRGNSGTNITNIGVICHEFGHVLGAPDYYDTDYSTGGSMQGTGEWDMMASGSWNNDGATPAHHNIFTKWYYYNWFTPTTLSGATTVTINNSAENAEAYLINTTTTNEYFLLENRQKTGFDAEVPGHGLLIYRIDQDEVDSHDAGNDINATHPMYMFPVAQNATSSLPTGTSSYGTINSPTCPWNGTGKTEFTDATTPSMKSWSGSNTNKPITNISESSGVITFDFMGGAQGNPTAFASVANGTDQIDLSWTRDASRDVLLAFNTTNTFGTPSDGVSYSAGNPITAGGTVIYSGSNETYSHTGLTANTTYYYKIFTKLNSTPDWSDGTTTNATTDCGTISSFPFTEDFSGGSLPSCWSNIDNDGSGQVWEFDNPGGRTFSSSTNANGFAIIDSDNYGSGGTQDADLVSPTFDFSSATEVTLEFEHYFREYSGSAAELSYSINGGSSWTQIQQWSSSSSNAASFSQTIAAVAGESAVKFKWNYVGSWGYYWCVDDVSISVTTGSLATEPTDHPTIFASTSTTSDEIILTWTDASAKAQAPSGYLIKGSTVSYGDISDPVDGTAEADGALVKNVAQGVGTATISGLSASTTYYFQVYSYNGTGSSINYKLDGTIPTATGTTKGPATITVSEASLDFENVYSGYYSRPQKYTVTGTDLTADVIVTAPTGIEVTKTCGTDYGSSVTLTHSGGSVNATVYARYTGGTISDNITHASTGATTKNVSISETASTSDQPVGYYASATGTGHTLRDNLSTIISTGHTSNDYGDLWTHFQSTDVLPNGKVWDMYSDKGGCVDNDYYYTFVTDQDNGTLGDAENQWYNREHSFPKSWWGGSTGAIQHQDLFHLIPTDKFVNNERSSYEFGEVSTGTTYTNGSMLGNNTYSGSSGATAYEPIDEYKGDIARSYFYMATRYASSITGWTTSPMIDGDDSDSDGSVFEEWALNMLLAWHSADPVDQKEMTRNDEVHDIQGNRNPFIDNPSYANAIWGTTPALSVSTSTLSGYSYEDGAGPSTSQSFNLSGTNLDGTQVAVSAPTNYEVSTDNSSFSSSVNVSYTAPTLSSTTIYVRLKAGLSVADYNNENVTCDDNGTASDVTVSNSGEVTSGGGGGGCASDLIISEVDENGSQTYIEFTNNTGSSISLADYDLVYYANGNTSISGTIDLDDGASIADGASYVLANSSASAYSGTPDQTSGSLNQNGNDVYALRKNSANIDVFGSIGSSSYFYDDQTAIRNSDITDPTTSYSSSDWTFTAYGGGDPADLGTHTMDCGSSPTLTVSVSSITGYTYVEGAGPSSSQSFTISGSDLDGTEVTITAPTNYEVSKDNSSFAASQTVAYTAPTLNSTAIYVRLKAGLSAGTYNSENVTCSDDGTASDVTVSNSGEVTSGGGGGGCASDLIISEVDENGSQTYIEFTNNTGSSISLADYDLVYYANGNTSISGTIDLDDGASIADGASYVLANSSASGYSGTPDQTSGSLNQNGNDVYALRKNSANIDVFGSIGSSSYFYDDQTAIRNSDITDPTTSYSSSDWTFTAYGGGDPTDLGTHTMDCGSSPTLTVSTSSLTGYTYAESAGPSSSQSFTISGSDLDGTEVTITAPTNYEVSKDNSSFAASQTVTYTAPTLNSTAIYVRLKAGLSVGTYNSENVTCSDDGTASDVTVSNNGEVTAAPDPEPTNHAASFVTTVNSSSEIQLDWTDNDGAQVAAGFLILANTSGTFADPVDGTAQADDTDLSDGSAVVNVAHGTETYTFNGLTANTQYFFTIYPYTNSGADIDYKTDATVPQLLMEQPVQI